MIDVAQTGRNIYSRLKSKLGPAEHIAEKLYVTPQAVYKWRYGRCLPSLDTLVRIADALGCSLDELVVREKK